MFTVFIVVMVSVDVYKYQNLSNYILQIHADYCMSIIL